MPFLTLRFQLHWTLYRELIRLRRNSRALSAGALRDLDGEILRFRRSAATQRLLVVLNMGRTPRPVSFEHGRARDVAAVDIP